MKFTLSTHNIKFSQPWKKDLLKTLWENAGNQHVLHFPLCFLPFKIKVQFQSHIQSDVCKCLRFRQVQNFCRLVKDWRNKHMYVSHLTLSVLSTTQGCFVDGESRSDCTECAVWSLIYTVHSFILDYTCNCIVSLSYSRTVFLAIVKGKLIYTPYYSKI